MRAGCASSRPDAGAALVSRGRHRFFVSLYFFLLGFSPPFTRTVFESLVLRPLL